MSHKSAIVNPFDLARFKSGERANTTLTTDFFTYLKEKRTIYALNNEITHFYSNDSKSFHTTQITITLIYSK